MKSGTASEPSRFTLSGEIKLRQEDLAVAPREPGAAERRRKARITNPFPVRVWGTDSENESFEIDCTLDNLSSTGLYLRLPRRITSGTELNVVIKFLNGQNGATALVRGNVLRGELQPDGRYGLALAIADCHFL